jgi:hypothetical protein
MNICVDEHTGGIAFWTEIKDIPRDVVHAAAEAAGIGRYVPAAPPVSTALREAMAAVARSRFGRRRHQPIVVWQTQQPRTFECVRVVRRDSVNDHKFLFSAEVDQAGQVKILDTNDLSGVTDSAVMATEEALREQVQAQVDVQLTILPGPTVTQVLARGLRLWGCQCLNDRGGLWFLPADSVDRYCRWSAHLAPTGCRFTHCGVTVSHNPEFVEHLLDELRSEVVKGLAEVTQDMLSAQGGMQDRSIRLRLVKTEKFLSKIAQYEAITGAALDDLREAAEQTKTALGVQKLLASSV